MNSCKQCGVTLIRRQNETCPVFEKRQYCSKPCYWKAKKGTISGGFLAMQALNAKRGTWNRGIPTSSQARQKMSLAKIGKVPWNKGVSGVQKAWNKGKSLSVDHVSKLSAARTKNPLRYWLGKKRPLSNETLAKMNAARKRGIAHHNWKGGVTPANEAARRTIEYKKWRADVFERDDFTCVVCGQRGGQLHADHIKPFACYASLRTVVSNGRTLCVPCHKATDTYGHKSQARNTAQEA